MKMIKNMMKRPKASEVLNAYIKQCNEPPWTSYFIRYKDVLNDQRGLSHFNWTLDNNVNYHILRTGCFPYIKYHCTKRPYEDLSVDDKFYRVIKVINLGLPTLFYGLAATQLISHMEYVDMGNDIKVPIYFLYEEDKGSKY